MPPENTIDTFARGLPVAYFYMPSGKGDPLELSPRELCHLTKYLHEIVTVVTYAEILRKNSLNE